MIRTMYYTFGACCVITRSLLKHTDLNITDFLSKILLFPENCASSGLLQDPSNKKKIIKKYPVSRAKIAIRKGGNS